MYRHAGIDIFLDPKPQGRGLGGEAVRTAVFCANTSATRTAPAGTTAC
jgi:hypothetical protein